MNAMFSVPTIDKRKRIPMSVIHALSQVIAERFHPQRIILFGSYAYGHPHPESDVDLLVIMDSPHKESEQALLIRQAADVLFGLDILVYKPETVIQRIEWGDSFLGEIITRGQVLYESADR